MSLHDILLMSVFVASLGTEVYACVCYVGQEANSVKGEPPLKSLPDQNPCECTEFRPGGVNTKRQAKPREVTFGNDGHPQGWTHKECIKETTLSDTMSPCGSWSFTTSEELSIPPYQRSFQSYPVTFEFTLNGSTDDLVQIMCSNNNIPPCSFELDAELQTMRIGDEVTNQYFPDAFDGSTHYWVLINQHKLEFGRLGETKSLECQSDWIIENIIIWTQSDTT
ncbi:uncharacterized protein [Asterias amurensis]|uniref:uncharacterized protein n=1 Tax=Asterias amurensis TaxID=7602 RepID=UPI003AB38D8C